MVEEKNLTVLKALRLTHILLLQSNFLLKKPNQNQHRDTLKSILKNAPKECNNLGNGHLQEIPGFTCF